MKRMNKQRIGIRVWVGKEFFDYSTATGWGIDNGNLGIGAPSGKYDVNNNEIIETIATFRTWDRVGWKF